MPTVQGTTHVICIIGDPIGHSLSPRMQNAAFTASNLDYIYVPYAVKSENLESAVVGLKSLGVCGFNVTIPHKSSIIPFLDCLDESAVSAGAVNTVSLTDGAFVGYNTDGDGLVASLTFDLGFVPGPEQILVVGAGGAARGAIASLCRSGAQKIAIYNRSLENARSVARDMTLRYPATCISVVEQSRVGSDLLRESALLLNTTSLGMKDERIEGVDILSLTHNAKVYDMVYSRFATPLVADALAAGLPAVNGLGMLVAQGERAFEIWTGQKPLKGVMRGALDSM
jgi:shikimate dehydrogenase